MKNKEKFEEKLTRLEGLIKELENGEVDLDFAIEKYSEAMKLAKECTDEIKKAEAQINKIVKEDGNLEPFEVE